MNPWIDVNDIRYLFDKDEADFECVIGQYSVYQWRDTTIYIKIDNDTNEIVDIYDVEA